MAFDSTLRRFCARCTVACLALVTPLAHAELVLAFADGPVTVIRGASLYRAGEGTRLRDDDIIETDDGKSAQLEDGAGTLIALGPQTRVLLATSMATRDTAATPVRIAMLSGWLKIGRVAGAAAPLPSLSIDMPGVSIKPMNGAPWSIVVTAVTQSVAIFAEAGDDALTLPIHDAGHASALTLRAGQYAERAPDGPLHVLPRPSTEFVARMPVGFRDSLVAVSGRVASRHELPAALRAVDYADVADWLTSSVSVRGTFVRRFTPRLKAPEFRSEVDAHLHALPEWRPVLHPPPR
ncbi:hypothetical protein [Burkholderia guangdongensis]|uniref:hypothetical protein n=1 Tax=Burkholderia guangdongensis TaxID=1792500 RepID=UPI0015CD8929|nr:hypothetical protein [Burkholderia guangdongensis]